MGKLIGKVAIISGAGRGIGRATAIKLATEGARVVVNDLDADVAQNVVQEIRHQGGQAIACAGSVTEDGFADRFVGAAFNEFERLDIIINNAGYAWDSVIQNMADEQFDAMLNVHLKAPFRILRAVAKPWRESAKREAEEGHHIFRKVVNVSSISGIYGNAGQANYSAGKAGIAGMTRSLAKEWGRYRINVNAIAFGLIQTRMTEAIDDEPTSFDIVGRKIPFGIPKISFQKLESSIPIGRAGTQDEAAGAIFLLCCPESDYITGHVLMVTGGL
jgi:3-oxoacyl-[acyl-carrier protein] reductase